MDILSRLKSLQEKAGWSDYRVAKESGLSPNTVANVFKRNNNPTVQTLEAICKAFGITLSQFFADGDMVSISQEQQELLINWAQLTEEQQQAVAAIIKAYVYRK